MPTFTVYAIIEGCFIQTKLQLSEDLEAQTVGTLGGLSHLEFMRQFTKEKTEGRKAFVPEAETLQAWNSAQPVTVLARKNVQATTPREAETNVGVELEKAVRLLSLITGNAGRIFAFLVTADDELWVRLYPPRLVTRLRLGFGNVGSKYETMLREHFQKAFRHPRLGLLYSLLYEANAEANWEFKFLKIYTVLEVASAHISVPKVPKGSSKTAERIKGLFRQMNVGLSMQPIDPSWPHKEDVIEITRQVRRRVAHDGKFDPWHPKVPGYCRDAVPKLPNVLDQVRSYAEVAVSFLANTLFK